MPFDLLPRSSDRCPGGDRLDLLAEFDLDRAPIWPEDGCRLEPIFAAGPQCIEFEEADRLSLEPAHPSLDAPRLVGFDEPSEGDFDRVQLRAEEPPPTPNRRASAMGVVGSLGVHLLLLVFLLGWGTPPAEVAAAIPIQLVIEEPPPQLPAPEPPPTASTRLASDDIGDTARTTAPDSPPPPPLSPRVAALVPPPKPSAPAKPAVAAPAPRPQPQPAPKEPPRAGRIPGPDATRDEYLAYLVSLTRQHVDLLPIGVIGDRRGETTLAVLVLGDGTIARIAIAQSSGYNDIDARIQQIVAAVRRFPPLPQRFPGPDLELKLRFRFPDAVLDR